MAIIVVIIVLLIACWSFASTQGLNQIATPDLPPEGELSLSFQVQDQKLGNPYQVQAEMGLTKWFEIAIFKGFEPNELIFGTEIGLLIKRPHLLSIGFSNWSPHSHVDPQPYRSRVLGRAPQNRRGRGLCRFSYRSHSRLRPMISMIHGACRSIFRAAPIIHPRSDLSGVLTTIFR